MSRPGHISAAGRERLRQAALRNRPWEASTGPRTAQGKRRASRNAVKHGRETTERRLFRRRALLFLRLQAVIRTGLAAGGQPAIDAGQVEALCEVGADLMHRADDDTL